MVKRAGSGSEVEPDLLTLRMFKYEEAEVDIVDYLLDFHLRRRLKRYETPERSFQISHM